MKKILILLFVLLSTFKMVAQTCPILNSTGGTVNCSTPCVTMTSVATPINATSTYAVSSIAYAPYSYTTGTNVSTTTDDIYTTGISIPFCFNFFGNNYTTLYIGSNGNITFNPSMSGAYDPWAISGSLPGSNSNATYDAIMSPWCDIYPPGYTTYPTGTGTIKYQTIGTSPCRAFVVSYYKLQMFSSSCTGVETSQIVLYETSNIIEIYIGEHHSCSSWNSGRAVTGIENLAGTLFYTAPGENGTTFTVPTTTPEGWRFSPSGTPYTWTYTWSGPSGPTTATVCPTVTTTYTATATTTTSCGIVTLTNPTIVTVTSTPISITGPTTVCQGNTITLSTTGTGGVWSSTNTGVANVSLSGVVTGISSGTSIIKYVNGLCSDSVMITVNPSYTSTTTSTICDNQTYTFAGNTYNTSGTFVNHFYTVKGCDSILTLNLTVNPTYNNTISANICQGDTFNFAGYNYTSAGSYTHTFTTIKGCDSLVTLNLTVTPLPSVDFYVKPYACIGDTVTVALTYHSNDVIDYVWTWPSSTNIITSSADHGGPYTILFNNGGIYTISVSATNGLCTKTSQDTIKIGDYPDSRIAPFQNNICFGETVMFRPLNITYMDFYRWTPFRFFYESESESLYNGAAYGVMDTSGWAILTVTTPYGCHSSDSVWVEGHSCCQLTLPSAFSPNGDGKNDKFGPIGQYYKLHEFVIKNRFGETVFETANPTEKWDGTFGGVPQDLGTYFYFIIYDCDGQQRLKKGDVTLVR